MGKVAFPSVTHFTPGKFTQVDFRYEVPENN